MEEGFQLRESVITTMTWQRVNSILIAQSCGR